MPNQQLAAQPQPDHRCGNCGSPMRVGYGGSQLALYVCPACGVSVLVAGVPPAAPTLR